MAPKARILAIDEQLYLRSFVEGVLSEAGYAVRSVESLAAIARTQGAGDAPDVLIFDPAQVGPDVAAAVASTRSRWPDAALLAVSAAADPRWGVAALRAGAGDCLQKPLDRDGLLRSVAGLIDPRPAHPDQSRLIDENVLLMGRVSVLERGLALFAAGSADDTARKFAELLLQESGAKSVELWAEPREEGELARTLILGDAPAAPTGEIWKAVAEPATAAAAVDPTLLIPCAREGRLLGVAPTGSRCER